ncbi:MAG: hypothetical protein JW751_13680 [Polyangiaceae bacterium]|nr:hypothetical protein [Polyangiaceae bacterium]
MKQSELLLGERAHAEGERWAVETRLQLHLARRRASGGWPGTVSEARARVATHLLPGLVKAGMAALSIAQREEAAQCVYRSARDSWSRLREPEADEESDK